MTAMIMPITICGGPPGGKPNANTNMPSPTPATVPSASPPRRAPIRMQARTMHNSIQIIALAHIAPTIRVSEISFIIISRQAHALGQPSPTEPDAIPWSINFEPLSPKPRASLFNRFASWRLNVVERVVEFEFLPFESAHLMKGQDIDSIHVPQAATESRNLGNISSIVCQPRHQHEAQPNRPLASGQTTCEIQDWANLHPGNLAVAFRIPALNIQQHQVDALQLCVGEAGSEAAVSVQSGMNSQFLRGCKQLHGKPVLHEGFASAQREPSRHDLQSGSILAQLFSRLPQRHRNAVGHIPGVRVVAVQASKLAARGPRDHTHPRPIDG